MAEMYKILLKKNIDITVTIPLELTMYQDTILINSIKFKHALIRPITRGIGSLPAPFVKYEKYTLAKEINNLNQCKSYVLIKKKKLRPRHNSTSPSLHYWSYR